MTGHPFYEQVGPYLLSALPDDERQAFEAHLDTCWECRADVDHLRVASDALPNSPLQLAPPPDLKGRIMAVVQREAELLRAAGPEADRAPEDGRRGRRVVAVLRRGWWSMRPGLALAASVLVLALGAGGALVGQSALTDDGPSAVQASVGSAELIQGKDGHSTLVVSGLEQPGLGRVYQVWLKPRGKEKLKPTNALFSTLDDGSASVDVPGSLKHVDQVLVTEEPGGGSEVPTSDPVIVADPA